VAIGVEECAKTTLKTPAVAGLTTAPPMAAISRNAVENVSAKTASEPQSRSAKIVGKNAAQLRN